MMVTIKGKGQSIQIGNVTVKVLGIKGRQVRLGIDALQDKQITFLGVNKRTRRKNST
jgi:sRNA-binding carbon storage regulator CsrA